MLQLASLSLSLSRVRRRPQRRPRCLLFPCCAATSRMPIFPSLQRSNLLSLFPVFALVVLFFAESILTLFPVFALVFLFIHLRASSIETRSPPPPPLPFPSSLNTSSLPFPSLLNTSSLPFPSSLSDLFPCSLMQVLQSASVSLRSASPLFPAFSPSVSSAFPPPFPARFRPESGPISTRISPHLDPPFFFQRPPKNTKWRPNPTFIGLVAERIARRC